ncbi:ATP-binding cassette domain-containing protein [Methanoregula sp.]|uniref:sulfate/molybdate ABC transporter ATP-binding protein n=1 Tax=Methanoregula sp. TaxID=2052170 RepID=UPI00262B885D|nr:ATP-binding cassette domain-containing protein [Methanoregula sp.]MDD5142712.1 ATP-binding cassette domain-containing protein [Methanoregula sp.]
MLEAVISKKLRDFTLDLTLSVEPGKILVLMGGNGSGKSTTLNIIAGLLDPDTGYVRLSGSTLCEPAKEICIPIERRRIGYVFQNAAVFPHLTVHENIAYGLRAQGLPRQEIAERVSQMVGLMHLDELAGVRASNLSGGQKQRVALGRAIAIQPSLLMMDEPFSSLDIESTAAVKELIREVVTMMDIPCILVTHRVADSREIGNNAIVLCSGKKEWEGDSGFIPDTCSVCHCPSGSP